MIQCLFISRKLSVESPLHLLCKQEQITLVDQGLLQFDHVPVSKLPEGDWLFFSSPRGVQFLASSIPPTNWSGFQLAAIGPGTAQALKNLNLPVDFVGTGDPVVSAQLFSALASSGKVIFPMARHSRRSIQSNLPAKFSAEDLVVYDNKQVPLTIIPPPELAILTSPLSLLAFLESNDPKSVKIWVAIGRTTQRAMLELGLSPVFVPDTPSESALVKLLREQGWLKNEWKP